MSDPLKPSVGLLTSLGSYIVHAEEYRSGDGHEFDRAAMSSIMMNPDVTDWLQQMDAMGLLPKPRKAGVLQ